MAKQQPPSVPTRGPTKQMRAWALVAVIAVTAFLLADIAGLFITQLVNGEEWALRASSQQLNDTVVTARRGTIYDAGMQPLAESADVWKIIMSPKDIASVNWKKIEGVDDTRELSDAEALELVRRFISKGLAERFGLQEDKVYRQTGKTDSQYEVIKSKVEYKDMTAFTDWQKANGLSGAFYVIKDYKRYYPQGTLASTVLGFTGADNVGLEGLESRYESVLSGTAGRIVTARNAAGDEMPTTMDYTKVVDAEDGGSLVLTLDSTVQMYAEKYLAEAVAEAGCTNRGVALVLNVKTCGVLACAVKGDFDPNDPFTITDPTTQQMLKTLSGDDAVNAATGDALQAQWRNKALTDTYEPGSVFKVFTTAMGLEESAATESTSFNCPGYYKVGGWTIHCHQAGGHGILDLPGAISKSCNPYFMQLGLKLGGNTFYKYFTGFGFTEKTGVDMNGEASNSGLYFSAEDLNMYEASLATAAFGQTFKITPMQMAAAFCAVANGGKLMTPYIVDKVLDRDGNVISSTQPTVKRQVISASTSARISAILAAAVNGGGSKNAYVAGYRVAGKTGTSEKRDMEGNEVVASFAGFAPADDPEIFVLVLLDQPQCDNRFGGTISAPVAQKIFSAVLPYLGVEPSYTQAELASLSRTTPNVVGSETGAAQTKVTNTGLKATVIGSGTTVLRQVPAAGQSIPSGGSVLLYTEEKEGETVTVPNFLGKTVTEVNTLAANYGLNVQLEGLVAGNEKTAISSKQSVEAGGQTAKGTVVTVHFLYEDTADSTAAG